MDEKSLLNKELDKYGRVNPCLLSRGVDDIYNLYHHSLSERIWLAVAEEFTSWCDNTMDEEPNSKYLQKEWGLESDENLVDWYGFSYSDGPDYTIHAGMGPDALADVVSISLVEMMKYNEQFRCAKNPEERLKIFLQLYYDL